LENRLFQENKNQRKKFKEFIDNKNINIFKIMINIRKKIMDNELDIYENDNPTNYIETIEKYIIKELPCGA
jgi:hypothetical protein